MSAAWRCLALLRGAGLTGRPAQRTQRTQPFAPCPLHPLPECLVAAGPGPLGAARASGLAHPTATCWLRGSAARRPGARR